MKRILVIVGLLALLVASAYGQQATLVNAKIPYNFVAAGKTMSAGAYEFRVDEPSFTMSVRNVETGKQVIVPILTELSNAGNVRVTFDVVGSDKVLEAVWPAGTEGYLLAMTKKKHTHETVTPE